MMGYRKVSWIEQIWYVIKWKLTHRSKGGGEEVKQTRYNYHGKPQSGKWAYERELEYLRTEPTARQKKFLYFLKKTLEEHGVEVPPHPYAYITRADYSERINSLVKLCEENGIEVGGNKKKFDRVLIVENDGSVKDRLVERKENQND